tara:strand:- start:4055 stop:9121 length:5067 start_codon:yes stop_codon:yes gene_type:complete
MTEKLTLPTEEYAATGLTAYNIVEGQYFMRKLPQSVKQQVKRTIQGISDSFVYESEDIGLNSLLKENAPVKVTENAYNGEALRVENESNMVLENKDQTNVYFNRMIFEASQGQYDSFTDEILPGSSHNEVIAIAVEDIRPFMLKNLNIKHRADLVNGKPTNDKYIQHLSPEKEPRIAVIEMPTNAIHKLTFADFESPPEKILVYYDAIDLTGEVMAGTSLSKGKLNASLSDFHANGDQAYLIVKKMIPAASTLYSFTQLDGGGASTFVKRSLRDILMRPYGLGAGDTQLGTNALKEELYPLKITSPGGLLSVPAKDFNKELKSHTMTSAPFGDITPSPFINVEKCVSVQQTSLQGYGRPSAIASITSPDNTANSDYNLMTVASRGGKDQKEYATSKQKPASFSKSNLQVYDIVDNILENNENLVLVHPSNKLRHSGLSDFITINESQNDPSFISIELSVMKGRIEEIAPETTADGKSKTVIRGRSHLMDLADQRAEKDFEMSKGTPIKEIGDLGTPTVSMTLGGVGQGGIDVQKSYTEHPHLKGWKDRIVTAGNPSVRNDKATSTMYASTRALVEFPVFPSMMFDVNKALLVSNEAGDPLPSDKAVELVIDCTMTAMNRPQMYEYENRFSVDWGMYRPASSIKCNNSTDGALIRCMKPSIQAVTTASGTWDSGATDYEIDLVCATGDFKVGMYVTIGEGDFLAGYPHGIMGVITAIPDSTHMSVKAYNPLETTKISTAPYRQALRSGAATPAIYAGIPIVLGAVLFIPGMTTDDNDARVIMASRAGIMIEAALGLSANQVIKDKNDATKWFIHSDGPDMGALEWDPFENDIARNDRPLVPVWECKSAALNLLGKTNGGDPEYVQPMTLNLGTIAGKKREFPASYDEIIRLINQAGHPDAKDAEGGSAFNPPPIFRSGYSTSTNTGSHMGYVRAFKGKEVESRSGERGYTIVIHSTVPGAAGRNFAVWFNNFSPYPYRPVQAFGFGGLVATNSRHFKANSFPAPLPLGQDGETYLPITTFTGVPHGSQLFNSDHTVSTYPDIKRRYDGIGGRTVLKTVPAPTVKRNDGTNTNAAASVTHNMIKPLPDGFLSTAPAPQIKHLALQGKGIDHWHRTFRDMNQYLGTEIGIIKVNGRYAEFKYMKKNPLNATDFGEDCIFLTDITPYTEVGAFYEEFWGEEDNTAGTGTVLTAREVDVEIVYPLKDSHGILFFGGGHTGVVMDIADGTGKDYSDEYKHYYSKQITPANYDLGATIRPEDAGTWKNALNEDAGGFSGFQNLGDVSTASAILDFTDIKNEDTINEDSLRGYHHRSELDSAGSLTDLCLLYARLNQDLGTLDEATAPLTDELYGAPLYTTTNGSLTAVSGPAYHANKDSNSKGLPIGFGDAVMLSEGSDEKHSLSRGSFNGRGEYTISAWIKPTGTGANAFFSGPVIHGIADGSIPWGLHIGGSTGGTDLGNLYLGLTRGTSDANNPVQVAFLNTTALPRGLMTYAGAQWIHIVAGYGDNDLPFCYMGSTGALYTNAGGTATSSNAMVDLSAFMYFTKDQHYKGNSANNVAAGFVVNATGSADHPAILSNISSAKRQLGHVSIGMALIGAPDIEIDPGAGHPATGAGGPMVHFGDGSTSSGYFHQISNTDTATRYYGTVASSLTTGANHAGPIHFQGGSLSDVAVFRRKLTFAEATALFTGKSVW